VAAGATTGDVADTRKMIKQATNLIGGLHDFVLKKIVTKDNAYSIQGFCYNSRDNVLLVGMANKADTAQIIQRYSVDGTYIDEVEYTSLGHINTLTYVPSTNEVYIVYTGSTYAILDATSLTIKSLNNTVSEAITGLAYDIDTDVFIGLGTRTLTAWNMYVYDKNMSLIKTVNIHDDTANETSFGITTNGLCARNGIVIILTLSYIYVYDYFGRMLQRNYIPQGRFTGQLEFEDCDFVDDTLYVSGLYSSDGKTFVIYTSTKSISNFKNLQRKESYVFFGDGSTNLDDYENPGLYLVAGRYTNAPTNDSNGLLIVYYDPTGINIIQDFISLGTVQYQKRYTRVLTAGTNVWKSWCRIDGYKTRVGKTATTIEMSGGTKSFNVTEDGIVMLSSTCEQFFMKVKQSGLTYQHYTPGNAIAKSAFLPVRAGQSVYVEVTAASNTSLKFFANE
jgi:hypothetical protein